MSVMVCVQMNAYLDDDFLFSKWIVQTKLYSALTQAFALFSSFTGLSFPGQRFHVVRFSWQKCILDT